MAVSECILSGGRSILQDDRFHKLGLDSVLLAAFSPLRAGSLVCELGAGQGGLSALLFSRCGNISVRAVEIVPEAAEIARLNIERCGFSDRFSLDTADLRTWRPPESGRFSLVISNPPYFREGAGRAPLTSERTAARGGANSPLTPDELCLASSSLLKNGGDMCVVWRAERLASMMNAMAAHRLEPKVLRLVSATPSSPPTLALIRAVKGGGEGLRILPSLFTRAPEGGDSSELLDIFASFGG